LVDFPGSLKLMLWRSWDVMQDVVMELIVDVDIEVVDERLPQ
jgi:hypothetical protein